MMRRLRRLTHLIAPLSAVCLILCAVSSRAQDEAPAIFPYFFQISTEVDSARVGDYSAAIGQIVAAHEKHENGRNWAAFNSFTGPGTNYTYFLPLLEIGEMDSWLANPQILIESLGAEAAMKLLGTLGETSVGTTRLLAYDPAVSNPDPAGPSGAPPRWVYHIRSRIDTARMPEYLEAIGKLAAAYNEHQPEVRWLGYSNMIGGEGSEFHFYVVLDTLAEIDAWAPPPVVLAQSYGPEEAARLGAVMGETSESETSILALDPTQSHIALPVAE